MEYDMISTYIIKYDTLPVTQLFSALVDYTKKNLQSFQANFDKQSFCTTIKCPCDKLWLSMSILTFI